MNTLKQIRENKAISQVELSKMIGVSQGAISQWETGQSLPRAELLPKIAAILDCTVDELLRDGKIQKDEHNSIPSETES